MGWRPVEVLPCSVGFFFVFGEDVEMRRCSLTCATFDCSPVVWNGKVLSLFFLNLDLLIYFHQLNFFFVCVFAAQLNLKRLMDSSTKRRSLCLEIYRQGRLLMSRRLPALMLCVLNQQAKLQRKPTTKGRLNGSLIREEKYKWRRCFIVIVTFWTWSSAYCLPATVGAKCAVWMTWSWKSISRPLK